MELNDIFQRFRNDSAELTGRFKSSAEKTGSTVYAAGDISSLEICLVEYAKDCRPAVCYEPAEILKSHGIPERLSAKGWMESTVPEECEIAVTTALFGIADTGSVFLDTSNAFTAKITALAKTHIVVLDPQFIVPSIYEGFEIMELLSRNKLNFRYSIISGPSRTADIERALTLGVHGPEKLAVLMFPSRHT